MRSMLWEDANLNAGMEQDPLVTASTRAPRCTGRAVPLSRWMAGEPTVVLAVPCLHWMTTLVLPSGDDVGAQVASPASRAFYREAISAREPGREQFKRAEMPRMRDTCPKSSRISRHVSATFSRSRSAWSASPWTASQSVCASFRRC